jgi:hypothetical protein
MSSSDQVLTEGKARFSRLRLTCLFDSSKILGVVYENMSSLSTGPRAAMSIVIFHCWLMVRSLSVSMTFALFIIHIRISSQSISNLTRDNILTNMFNSTKPRNKPTARPDRNREKLRTQTKKICETPVSVK